uniref:Uncharacterized protein n=1 Tax=Oryza barthii TaxID=65489 RepID=A0A0D3HRB7_9ORYZ
MALAIATNKAKQESSTYAAWAEVTLVHNFPLAGRNGLPLANPRYRAHGSNESRTSSLASLPPQRPPVKQRMQLSSFASLAQASSSSAMAVLDAGTAPNPLFLYAGTSLELPFLYAIIVGCMVVVVAAAMAP